MIKNGIGLLGGSFNPVHNGHLRMAIQAAEALCLDRVDLVPAKSPPHKSDRGLLPFDFRVKMLQKSIQGRSFMRVSDVEGKREGPSYTVDTLRGYREKEPESRIVFILGANDLLALCEWHRWKEIFSLADIAVVERKGIAGPLIEDFLQENFPWSLRRKKSGIWLVGESTVRLVSMPRMDLSSSLLRGMWLSGEKLDFMLPDSVLDFLRDNRDMVDRVWSEQTDP
ncbi:MAG: nicotinate (nicotinamide) nucleotide adenylyltransferase [Thermodesulfobacteriota bacterium]